MSEERIVNEKTGGEKGAKREAMSLIPLDVLKRDVSPHYRAGADKYAPDNWRKGYDWSLSADALLRHFAAFWSEREELDEETGTHHLAAVVFHALALLHFVREHPDLDDRPQRLPS
jgi:hypothetical protein